MKGRRAIVNQRISLSLIAAVVVLTALCATTVLGAPSFQGIGFLPGGTSSSANGISGDGKIVIGSGNSTNGASEALRWEAGVSVGLGSLYQGASFSSQAYAISGDGSTIVGRSLNPDYGYNVGFRWTSDWGMIELQRLFDGTLTGAAQAMGVNNDGSLIGGQGTQGTKGVRGCYWPDAFGPAFELGTTRPSRATDISEVAARRFSGYENGTAARQAITHSGTAKTILPNLAGATGTRLSEAQAITKDANYIAGYSASGGTSSRAARWAWDPLLNGGLGAYTIMALSGAPSGSYAMAISEDGQVLVGAGGGQAFIWDPIHGYRNVIDVLKYLGFDMTGWTLTQGTGISFDGYTLCGMGTFNGVSQGWTASVPEPSSLLAFAVGLTSLAGALIRRRTS